jgi:integrase
MNVAFIARQLGHATAATTLNIYAHLFDETANIGRVREYVNGQFGNLCAVGGS